MRYLIIAALLFSTSLNVTNAQGVNTEEGKHIIAYIKDQSLAAPPVPNAETQSFKKPYYNKNGLLSQIVYLNFKGNHLPVKTTDYMFWFLIGIVVIVLVMVLYVGVFSNVVSDRFRELKKGKQDHLSSKNTIL